MPVKAFCDNCQQSIENPAEIYGIIFLMPSGNIMRPKEVHKMLCLKCFVLFYREAGFKWDKSTVVP